MNFQNFFKKMGVYYILYLIPYTITYTITYTLYLIPYTLYIIPYTLYLTWQKYTYYKREREKGVIMWCVRHGAPPAGLGAHWRPLYYISEFCICSS